MGIMSLCFSVTALTWQLLPAHAGMGAQKLDASTGTRGSISLADSKHDIGGLKYHLNTHDYDFRRPSEPHSFCSSSDRCASPCDAQKMQGVFSGFLEHWVALKAMK